LAEEFRVAGLAELYQTLEQLPLKLEKNILRGAIRAGAKVVADDARRRAPVLTEADPRRVPGALAKSVRVMSTGVKGGVVKGGVVVGQGRTLVGRGAGRQVADVFYAHFVEYGTVNMAARPFLRPAMDSKSGEAVEVTAQYIRDRLESEALK